jgi:Preprotein translocase subunit YajC
MTTSGLYGTVTAVNQEDDTVLLSIAPGVEVKFAFAALRDAASLPTQYRAGTGPVPRAQRRRGCYRQPDRAGERHAGPTRAGATSAGAAGRLSSHTGDGRPRPI